MRNAFAGMAANKDALRARSRSKTIQRAAIETLEQRKYLAIPIFYDASHQSGGYEGQPAEIGVYIEDPDHPSSLDHIQTVHIDWGDGTSNTYNYNPDSSEYGQDPNDFFASVWAFSHSYADNPVSGNYYHATITATDMQNEISNPVVVDVIVVNVAPTATISNSGPVAASDSVTISFGGQFDSSSVDTLAGFTYLFDFNNDNDFDDANEGSGSSPSRATAYGTPGQKVVRARIRDKDGGFTDYTTTFTVNGTAPTITLGGGTTVNEGSSYSLTLGSVVDPEGDTVTNYRVNWGDGSTITYSASTVAAASRVLTHVYADDGARTIVVDLQDADNSPSYYAGVAQKTVTVQNVAPTATIGDDNPVDVGEAVTVNFSGADDASSIDDQSLRYDFALSEAGLASNYAAAGTSDSDEFTFVTADVYKIWGRVYDKDGGYNTYTTFVDAVYPLLSLPPGATLIPIPGTAEDDPVTLGDDELVVEFRMVSGQRSVEWTRNGTPFGPFDFGPGDRVQIDGFGGDDEITIYFDENYVQNDLVPEESITLIANGGYGHDTFHVHGGPGRALNQLGILWINGLDHDRESWNEIGDRDSNDQFGIDTVHAYSPWGAIRFDDGDRERNPLEEPGVFEGATDPVYIHDENFSRYSNTVWVVAASDLINGAGRVSDTLNDDTSSAVGGGHNFDPIFLTTGSGNDSVRIAGADNVQINTGAGHDLIKMISAKMIDINAGEGNDTIMAGHATDDGSAVTVGEWKGEAGNDSFLIGSHGHPGVVDYHDLQGFGPTIRGGDGHDRLELDDSGGEIWGWIPFSTDQEKGYFLSEFSFRLGRTDPENGLTFLNRFEMEEITLRVDEEEKAGITYTLTTLVRIDNPPLTEILHIHGGSKHDVIKVQAAAGPVNIYASGGHDNITVGTAANNPVTTHFKSGQGAVEIGSLTINHLGTAIVEVGQGNEFSWTSLSMPDQGGNRGTLDVESGIVNFGALDEVVGDLIIRADGVAVVDVGIGDDLTWDSLSMPDAETGGTIDVTSGTVTFGDSEDVIGDLIIRENGVAVVDVTPGDEDVDLFWNSISFPGSEGARGTLIVDSGAIIFDTPNQIVGNLVVGGDGIAYVDVDPLINPLEELPQEGIRIDTLNISTGGALDILSGYVILSANGNLELADVRSLLHSGYDHANWYETESGSDGQWEGDGIRSSYAAGSPPWGDTTPGHLGLGYGTANDHDIDVIGNFNNLSDEIIIRVAILGDYTLKDDQDVAPGQGFVSQADQTRVAQNWQSTGTGKFWKEGDANYDGVVNVVDLYLMGLNWDL